jgi:hypothetical protein
MASHKLTKGNILDTSNDTLRDSLESAIEAVEAPVEATETPVEAIETDRTRDDKGRFAKKAEEPPEAVEEPVAVEQPVETPAERQERLSPKSWRKEIAEKYWGNLDPELQAEIERREQDVNKGFEQYRPKAQLADEFNQALQPYMPTIQALGVHPAEATARLFNVEHQLRFGNEQQKMATVQTIFQEYGIDPNRFYDHLQNTPPPDPRVQAMQRYVQQLEQQYNQVLTQQQQREQYALNSEIQAFAADKEHFDTVREDMAALLQAGRAADLQSAYDMAVYANPTTRAAMLQQQSAQHQAKAQTQRATSAAVSVKGSSPVSGTSNAPKGSLRDELEAALANHF